MVKRSARIVLSAMFLSLAAACSDSDSDYSRACLDEEQQRVDDDNCDRDGSHFHWFYIPSSYSVPPVGSRVDTSKGSFTRPTGTISSVSRGGFGGRTSGGS